MITWLVIKKSQFIGGIKTNDSIFSPISTWNCSMSNFLLSLGTGVP